MTEHSLEEKLIAPGGAVRLYGTTPPRAGASDEVVRSAAGKLNERIERLPLDGLVVYDLQDETGRTAVPRPFPFARTIDSRAYAALLGELTGHPAIAYKCIGMLQEAEWGSWLEETGRTHHIRSLSIVGRPTSAGARSAMSVTRALDLAAVHPARFLLGGVAIAEREDASLRESHRMVGKIRAGCGFFVSQAVYSPEPTIRLLGDYARVCRDADLAPRRIVLTFTPCGREKTMAFIKWLGIAVPEATERAILTAPNALAKSIEIGRDNLRRILDDAAAQALPLGVNVESGSINRAEIAASIDLFHALSEVLAEHPNGRA